MKKKILSCLMAVMIFVSSIPSTIFAFEDTSLDTQKTEETKADHLPQSDGNNLRLWYTNPGSAATWTNTAKINVGQKSSFICSQMDSFTAETRAARGLPPERSNRKCRNVPRIAVNRNPAVWEWRNVFVIDFLLTCF